MFTNFFFNLIINNLDQNTLLNSLENLAGDFQSINFPVNLELDLFFISFLISLVNSILIIRVVFLKIKLSDPLILIKKFIILFFINCGTLFTILYFLRIYNLPRSYIVLQIIIFPFVFLLLTSLLKIKFLTLKNTSSTLLLIFILICSIALAFSTNNQSNESEISVSTVEETTTTTVPFLTSSTEGSCFKWLGSENYKDCIVGSSFKIVASFDDRLTNAVVFENRTYILQNNGIIFEYQDGRKEVFLDISKKVGVVSDKPGWSSCFESGLFGLAFHPDENYFIVSYSDLESNLVFEKFDKNNPDDNLAQSGQTVLKIPNPVCEHYSGNIIWSPYFGDFIISVGDMKRLNPSDPLFGGNRAMDTSSLKGKIFLLNKEVTRPVLISENKNSTSIKNLIAIGLRNPWKTLEYNGYLFVPDVGWASSEELNLVNLEELSKNKTPFIFGWPFFEGSVNNNLTFSNLSVWSNESQLSVITYANEMTTAPIVHYNRPAPDANRAAIVGGDIIKSQDSKYFEHYIFADFLSKELFAYDFKNDALYTLPLPEEFISYITSVTVSNEKQDTVLITTGAGVLYEIKLP